MESRCGGLTGVDRDSPGCRAVSRIASRSNAGARGASRWRAGRCGRLAVHGARRRRLARTASERNPMAVASCMFPAGMEPARVLRQTTGKVARGAELEDPRELRSMFDKMMRARRGRSCSSPSRSPRGRGRRGVWDYPRPAICEPTARDSWRSSSAGVRSPAPRAAGACWRPRIRNHYYFSSPRMSTPPPSCRPGRFDFRVEGPGRPYFDVVVGDVAGRRGRPGVYPRPTALFRPMAGLPDGSYPAAMEACFVDRGARRGRRRAGSTAAGSTSKVVGPFKGPPGTRFW